ncbi:two component transcriptional regulator, LuxR family [Rhodobacterales bacterium Y4I]|nr:two component transcriptional regulator, LuxR family [Rhodobacterales bacterium Y4I]
MSYYQTGTQSPVDNFETLVAVDWDRELQNRSRGIMRILLADDHDMVRETISAYLRSEGGAEVALATDLPGAIEQISDEGPFDLVLLDYNMPGMMGLDGLSKALTANGGKGVAILSGSAPARTAQEALDAGAIGFIPKTMGAQSLLNAVRFMSAGEIYVPVDLMREEAAASTHPLAKKLSPRELEVLNGLSKGLSNKEIARELELQEVTIKLHVRTLCRKLDAKNRTQAALCAKEAGLF